MSIFEQATLRPVTLCGRQLPPSVHLCAFFESEKQEDDCLIPFFAEGLEQGEQVLSIRDAAETRKHADKLRAVMPDRVDPAIRANQLRIVASEEAYLRDGYFEAERMHSMVESVLEDAASRSTSLRGVGSMNWALREMPGTEELMEYESRLNKLISEHDCTIMCVYDVNKFSGRAVMDVLATHPMVIMGDRIYENPYYVEPRTFLQTLIKRGSSPLARADA